MVNTAVAATNFTMPGTVAPTFVGRYTQRGSADYVTGNGFTIVVQLSKPGGYYFVVLPYQSPQPAAADVATGTAGSSYVQACGFVVVGTAYANATVFVQNGLPISGNGSCAPSFGVSACCSSPNISSQVPYDIWLLAQDNGQGGLPLSAVTGSSTAPNVQLVPTRVLRSGWPPASPSVLTADVTPPSFVNPGDGAVTQTPAGPVVSGTVYPPTLAGPGAQPAYANGAPLTLGPPSVFLPLVSNLTVSGFSLTVSLSEVGDFFFVALLANNTAAPSQAQILAGVDSTGAKAPAAGNISCPVRLAYFSTVLKGLPKITLFGDLFNVFYFAQARARPPSPAPPGRLAHRLTPSSAKPPPAGRRRTGSRRSCRRCCRRRCPTSRRWAW